MRRAMKIQRILAVASLLAAVPMVLYRRTDAQVVKQQITHKPMPANTAAPLGSLKGYVLWLDSDFTNNFQGNYLDNFHELCEGALTVELSTGVGRHTQALAIITNLQPSVSAYELDIKVLGPRAISPWPGVNPMAVKQPTQRPLLLAH